VQADGLSSQTVPIRAFPELYDTRDKTYPRRRKPLSGRAGRRTDLRGPPKVNGTNYLGRASVLSVLGDDTEGPRSADFRLESSDLNGLTGSSAVRHSRFCPIECASDERGRLLCRSLRGYTPALQSGSWNSERG
jgi:hypothetical protein